VHPEKISEDQARKFLTAECGSVEGLEPLGGGFWSTAFGFSLRGGDFVVRFGENREWFEADRAAMAFGSPSLPVPEVIEVGEAFGGVYAISVRYQGIYLENVGREQVAAAGPMLASLLGALFEVPKSPDLPVLWHSHPGSALTWRDWLLQALVDNPGRETHGWREALAADSRLDGLFSACEAQINELVHACPERRDLIHGDLLHANVLVTEDARRPNAVFSWKCSLRGDFLFDVAWCAFWSAFHPGIAAAEPWNRVLQAPWAETDPTALMDASIRRHCYELHIGATHLRWSTWVGDFAMLSQVADRLSDVLDRGPLAD
jgi:aminoglycoside phosphotransferase (APT) family kinase protein